MSWFRSALVFLAVSALTFALLVLGLAVLVFPGRGFLPFHRRIVLVDMVHTPDRGWQTVSVAETANLEPPPPEAGVRVVVLEQSMGRDHPGGLAAWRSRIWMVSETLGARTRTVAPVDHALRRETDSPSQNDVATAVEREVIPKSPTWSLWPKPVTQHVRRQDSTHLFWSSSSSGRFIGTWIILGVVSTASGAVASVRVSKSGRERCAATDPRATAP